MKWRPLAFLLVPGILGSAGPRSSLAADDPCAPMAIATDTQVRSRWPDLPEQIRRAFEARADVDTCAQVRVTMPAQSITVEVVLPDGRAAARAVSEPGDVVATLQALLLVPAASRPAAAPPVAQAASLAPAAKRAPDQPPPAAVKASNGEGPAPLPAPAVGGLGFELSVLAGTRAGDGQTGAGLGVLTLLEASGWLVGFSGRGDFYEPIDGGPPSGALVLAILGGHRFRTGTLALDLTAGPALALLGTMTSVTQMAPAMPPLTLTTPMGTSRRLVMAARLNFRARSVLRTFVGVDGEVGATHRSPFAPHDIGQLPTWGVGLFLGATVGTL